MIVTKSINVRELKEFIDGIVEEKLYQILKDPDEGLEISDSIKKRLEKWYMIQ